MKLISLIISSHDVPQYKEMRELATLYHSKMQDIYDYRFFFVEFREDISCDIEERGNFIYVKGKENFYVMFDKIMKAIQFLHGKYEYDYILRTNLSSFWNLPKLFSMEHTFTSPFAGGIIMKWGFTQMIHGKNISFNQFISGTGIFLSRDVAYQLSMCMNDYKTNDDIVISYHLSQITQFTEWNNSYMYYMVDGGTQIPEDITNILYFRIKNANRDIDIEVFRKLLMKIYAIEA